MTDLFNELEKKFFLNGEQPNRRRLRRRHVHLIEQQKEHIVGKKIVDLGCQNGRWSFAALNHGAKEVIGVDARSGVDDELKMIDQFSFVNMNVDKWDSSVLPNKLDTVFCFGLFYHVINHFMIAQKIFELQPEVVIFDTGLIDTEVPLACWFHDDGNNLSHGVPQVETTTLSPIGVPSIGAMKYIGSYFGYSYEEIEWSKAGEDEDLPVSDYFDYAIPNYWKRLYPDNHPELRHIRKSFLMKRIS